MQKLPQLSAALLVLVSCLFVSPSLQADVFLTGAELNTDPNTTFVGTRTRAVNGDSLDFGMSAAENEGLFFYNLFDAGTLDGSRPMTEVTVDINVTRVSDDHDVFMGLWDGTNFLAVSSFDGDRSSRYSSSTFDGTNFVFDGFLDVTNYSASFAIGESFDIGGIFNLDETGISFATVLPDGTLLETVTPAAFDRTAAISLVFGLNTFREETRINSLSITTVPEPSSMTLWGLCLGLAAVRRKR